MTIEEAKYRLSECQCRDALYEGFVCEGCQIAEITISNYAADLAAQLKEQEKKE